MNNKYVTQRQLIFTKCEFEIKCEIEFLEKITKKYKKYAPQFHIFCIDEEKKKNMLRMELTFINPCSEIGLKTMEKEIDDIVTYISQSSIRLSQINFSHKISEDYIPYTD